MFIIHQRNRHFEIFLSYNYNCFLLWAELTERFINEHTSKYFYHKRMKQVNGANQYKFDVPTYDLTDALNH